MGCYVDIASLPVRSVLAVYSVPTCRALRSILAVRSVLTCRALRSILAVYSVPTCRALHSVLPVRSVLAIVSVPYGDGAISWAVYRITAVSVIGGGARIPALARRPLLAVLSGASCKHSC